MWLQAGLTTLGVGAIGFAWGMVPLCAAAVVLSFALGAAHKRRAERRAAGPAPG